MQNHDIPEILFEQINKSLERPAQGLEKQQH